MRIKGFIPVVLHDVVMLVLGDCYADTLLTDVLSLRICLDML